MVKMSYIPRHKESCRKKIKIKTKFNKNEYSYILFESQDLMLEKVEIEKRVKIIYAILATFLCNQFYLENYYYFKKEDNTYEIIKAQISSLPDRYTKEVSDYSFFTALSIQSHLGDIFQSLMNHPLSDSIFYIIATLMACLREETFETGAILGWNVLEHLSSKYWNKMDKQYLYKIREEKYKSLYERLKKDTESFIKNLDKEEMLLRGTIGEDYRKKIKSLFLSGLSSSFYNFSPTKYRIKSMFEKENILEDGNSYYIDNMNFIRQKLLHDGLSLQQIESLKKIDSNLTKFLEEYKAFIYRKMLKFLKIIDDHARFVDGRLIFEGEEIESSDLIFQSSDPEEESRKLASFKKISTQVHSKEISSERTSLLKDLLQKINEFLKNIQESIIEAKLKWKENEKDIKIKVLLEQDADSLVIRMDEIPSEFFGYIYGRHHEVRGDNPEDNINLIEPIVFESLFQGYQLQFITRRIKERGISRDRLDMIVDTAHIMKKMD